ncbi:tRNA CCA-pyrophosphorylase [Listeria floridensis FSL S10-1187]|uniref:CCA-adding enzyme n=1 Tax=Listeria floridensis FSL S10-1187 TaxID=1265817 RepID=A0ABP3B1E8_9LIST|nr:CCA tRNA nucleotidyltransferase [Listeria floridensis]EUJ32951.1 tRNA CCA-pyrophosphorylase [Listeria floridensis FSL S10-1187]
MELIFKEALPVLETLESGGFEAYFVGGAVRDHLLGRPVNDVDIATSAFPEEVKGLFHKTYDTGIKHGTVTVRNGEEMYEVTTFRTEGKYEDFRRPSEVTFVRSLDEDLLRRDFTMNAIAMDRLGKLHDPFHGEASIHAREIKAVGDARERFHEDALRMMRAVRFLSQLEFTLEAETKAALASEIELLRHTAVERIAVEWVKILRGRGRAKALDLALEVKMERYLPGLSDEASALEKLKQYSFSADPSDAEVWLGLLLAVQPDSVRKFLRGFKQSNQLIKELEGAYQLIETKTKWTPWTLYMAGETGIRLTEIGRKLLYGSNGLDEALCAYRKLPIHSRSELAVDGSFLMTYYNKAGGSWLRDLLLEIEQLVVSGELENKQDTIRGWLQNGKR